MAINKVKLPNGNTEDIQDSRIPGVDSTPTANSANLITSGGVKSALGDYLPLEGGTLTIARNNVLTVNSSGNASEAGILFNRNGVNKAWIGYHDTVGAYLYNSTRAKYLAYKDDGSLLFENNKVWHEGNDGSGSELDADLLDGKHASGFVTNYADHMPTTEVAAIGYGQANDDAEWATYGPAIIAGIGPYKMLLQSKYDEDTLFWKRYANGTYGSWKQIAFTDSNVASATKLQTARKIWGQDFDGGADVDGQITVNSNLALWANGTANYTVIRSDIGDKRKWQIDTIDNGARWYVDAAREYVLNLASNGNVGIGTDGPAYKLDVNGSAAFGSSGSCDVYLRRAGLNYIHADAASNGAIQFTANSNNVMMVHSHGVSIGHQYEHDYALEVAGDTKSDSLTTTLQTSQPSGGMLPNREYKLGTLSSATTFTLAAETSGVTNHYFWTFETGSTAPTITWPSAITSWAGGSAPSINSNRHYEVSVLNGVAVVLEV